MKLILLLLLLIPGVALAQATHGFTFTWDDPTERTDGQALDPDAEIQSYRMNCEGAESVERIVDRAATISLGGTEREYQWIDAVQRGGWYDCNSVAGSSVCPSVRVTGSSQVKVKPCVACASAAPGTNSSSRRISFILSISVQC